MSTIHTPDRNNGNGISTGGAVVGMLIAAVLGFFLRGVVDRLVSETAEGVRPEIANAYADRPLEGEPYRIAVLGDPSKNTPPFASRTV